MMYHDYIGQRKKTVELSQELAPFLGANRDGRVTAENSRGLLVTLLGEFVLTHGESAWTQTLIEAMQLVDVQEKAVRQVIGRMHEKGWLSRERIGRRTCWALTPSSRLLLSEGAQRIYGFGSSRVVGWDGRWALLLVSVPERERHVRYRLNIGLTWAGFGSLGQGTWISPWADREREAVRVLEDLDVDYATSFTAELGTLGSGADLAGRAWDLPAIREQYESFLSSAPGPQQMGQARSVGELIMLVHQWRRFPFLDPGLPRELLPTDWPGPLAAQEFAGRRADLIPAAHAWWVDTQARFG